MQLIFADHFDRPDLYFILPATGPVSTGRSVPGSFCAGTRAEEPAIDDSPHGFRRG
jgi:hypothetical protein